MNENVLNKFNSFPTILKELRTQSEMTQKQVADYLGIRYQSYQAYEHGTTLPTLENFVMLAELFEVSLDYLIGESEV